MTEFPRRASLDFKTQYGLGFSSQDDEIIVDLFCGGGGAGTGLEMGLGRPVAVAKNYSAAAISMHAASSPPKALQILSTAIQGVTAYQENAA